MNPSQRPGAVPSPLEIDAEEMRRLGYEAVDRIVARWEGLREDTPWRGAGRAEMEALLPRGPAPSRGRDPGDVLAQAAEVVLPVAGRIDHPRFFAFVPSSPTWPGVLADVLSTGFNVFQGTWLESAGPSQLELVVVDWFRRWLGWPDSAGGLFTSGGSAANLGAVVAARRAAGEPARPLVYVSAQGHSSLARAARIAGVAEEDVRTVPVDGAYRMRPDALREALREDRRAGGTPVCVCATAGATNTGATDPLPELVDVAAEAGVWLHVDAAYGGFAILTERGREAFKGIEGADSVTLDPHKWLFQPYEAGCLLVRDTRALEDAFRVLPEYLQDTEMGLEHVNFSNRGVQLTRAFRALKVWMTVETFGVDAIRAEIDRALDVVERAGAWIREAPLVQLLSPPSLGVVCFRLRPPAWDGDLDELNRAVQDTVVEEGTAMMSSTRLEGSFALRFCVLNYRSTWDDVEATLERIVELGRREAGT